ncbi:MAG: ribonuclease D [Xanthomonadales bacterium]|nr:ribonuclease D [Xanthomonadales bacterium]
MSSGSLTVDGADESGPAREQAWRWIDDAQTLNEVVDSARSAKSLAIDTEFVRRRTYYAELGLVQLAVAGELYLLDPLAIDAGAPLGQLLGDAQITKLIHAGGEDIEVLERWSGVRPVNLIDTQIASQLSGVPGQIGYQRLVAERLGVQLSKGEQQSDWLKRPLSARQCDYAADDVRYLQPLADQLFPEIERLGRREWLEEECLRQIDRVLAGPSDYPHLNERNAGSYPPQVQWRLCLLLRWREREAQRKDKPRSWILDNGLAIAIAHCASGDDAAVVRCLKEAGRRDPQASATPLRTALAAGGQMPADFPLAPPPIDGPQKQAVKALRAALGEVAEALGLAPELIATRAVLEQAIRERAWPQGIGQWRAKVLEKVDPSRY